MAGCECRAEACHKAQHEGICCERGRCLDWVQVDVPQHDGQLDHARYGKQVPARLLPAAPWAARTGPMT